MELSRKELINKFSFLKKFEDQKWLSEESVKADCNFKELPLKAAFFLIKDLISFTDQVKFTNNWERCFSIKTRLKQIESLLNHFCADTIEEKAIKGIDLGITLPPRPIRTKLVSKKVKQGKDPSPQP